VTTHGNPNEPLEVRERQTTTDRVTGRSCAQCTSWFSYSGVGRVPKFCSQSCRQRAYELRRARAEVAAGAAEPPVREVVQRTETVTRTVVRSGWPLLIPSEDATAQTSVAGAGGWAAVLQLLTARLRDGTVGQDGDWMELQAAFAGLQAVMADPPKFHPNQFPGTPPVRVRERDKHRETMPLSAAQWLVSLRALSVRLHQGDLALVDDPQWPAVERMLREVAGLADFTLPMPLPRRPSPPPSAAPGVPQESRQQRRQREREERKQAARNRH
jgi:hypothetical protein